MSDLATWTPENPLPAVRIADSQRIRAAKIIGVRVLVPARGVSLGVPGAVRVPCEDDPTCPACRP